MPRDTKKLRCGCIAIATYGPGRGRTASSAPVSGASAAARRRRLIGPPPVGLAGEQAHQRLHTGTGLVPSDTVTANVSRSLTRALTGSRRDSSRSQLVQLVMDRGHTPDRHAAATRGRVQRRMSGQIREPLPGSLVVHAAGDQPARQKPPFAVDSARLRSNRGNAPPTD